MQAEAELGALKAQIDPHSSSTASTRWAGAAAIARFSAMGRGRLDLQLSPHAGAEVRVSQERAVAFRAWVGR